MRTQKKMRRKKEKGRERSQMWELDPEVIRISRRK